MESGPQILKGQPERKQLFELRTLERIIQQINVQLKKLNRVKEELEKKEKSLKETKSKLEETKSKIKETKSKIEEIKSKIEEIKSKIEEIKSKIDQLGIFLNSVLEWKNSVLTELENAGLSSQEIEEVFKKMFRNLFSIIREYLNIIRTTEQEIEKRLKSKKEESIEEEKEESIEELIKEAKMILSETEEKFPFTAPPSLLEIIIQRNKNIAKLRRKNPEAFVGTSLLQLRKYKEALDKGEIVMTPWVERRVYEIIDHLLSKKPRPVFIYGETGSGKTEIAKYIAEMINPTNGYELVRGHRFMGKEELLGYVGLTTTPRPDLKDISDIIKEAYEKFLKEHPEASEEEKEEALKDIRRAAANQAADQATISKYFLGPVYRAMKEGKVLIIDEANYIPPGLLASLNPILSNPAPGTKFTIPENNEEITIAPGFCVIMTGNITLSETKRYTERHELDPAFRDRVKLIEYNTPPQEYAPEKKMTDPGDRDLFLIALATLVDNKGNLVLPGGENGLEKVYKLCQGFKLFQDIFAGKKISEGFEYETESGQKLEIKISKNNLSMRKLLNILNGWKEEGFRYPLDYYLFLEVIEQARDTPEEAKYFYHVFKAYYGFFKDWGDEIPDKETVESKIIEPQEQKTEEQEQETTLLPVSIEKIAEAMTGESLPILVEKNQEKISKFRREFLQQSGEYKSKEEELKKICPR